MAQRLYWKLAILEFLGALAVLVFFAPALRASFASGGVTVLERSDHSAVVELALPSYQIETRQDPSFYSTIALDAPGWTTRRDAQGESAALPVLVYRLPVVANTMHTDVRILEQETEKQSLVYPLSDNGLGPNAHTNIQAYVDTSGNAPVIVIQWSPFGYGADLRELVVQRRVKIQIEN